MSIIDPVETVLDPLLSTDPPAEPAPAPAAPAEQPAPAVEPPPADEPDQTALLQVEAACKICRGAGENYTFKNDQPYMAHLKQDHPDSFPPEA